MHLNNVDHRSKVYENLEVNIYPTRECMGKAAATHVASTIRELHARQQLVNIVFAAAPSQNEFLSYLSQSDGIHWSRVIGFHMDEYIGLPKDAGQLFSKYLMNRLFSKVLTKEVHIIDSQAVNPVQECARYAALLRAHPTDIVCLGVGENGHIAFNDPPVADFNDPFLVKVVELDAVCRQQQVNDGCFSSFGEVPTHAITLTIPALMSARYVSIVVPSDRKANAVRDSLLGPVTTKVPASIFRSHKRATMFVDERAASLL